MTQWRADVFENGEAHVRPVDDLVHHEMDAGCVCAPTPKRDETPRGDGWTYIHHSLDARERADRSPR